MASCGDKRADRRGVGAELFGRPFPPSRNRAIFILFHVWFLSERLQLPRREVVVRCSEAV